MNHFETLSMIGLGYIGLPTATVFANRGLRVTGVDISKRAVDAVNAGLVHFVEPGLDELLGEVIKTGRLRAVTVPEPADCFIIAVPTPFNEDRQPDLSYVKSATYSIAPVLRPGDLVVLESTSPVGTTQQVEKWLAEMRPDLKFYGDESDIDIAYCPERILPGNVLHELEKNSRVIGGLTPRATKRAQALYSMIVTAECHGTDARTAEMCKLVENASRDVQISFANELSIICDEIGVDVWKLIELANLHPRVNILQPGAGVGGHCIAVDPWFIISSAPESARLMRLAREINDTKPDWVMAKIKAAIADHLTANASKKIADVTVACMGLAFKPNIDDLRESPALLITQNVEKIGVNCLAVEPNITQLPETLADSEIGLVNQNVALEKADIVVILVKHSPFIDLEKRVRPDAILIDVVGLSGSTR